MGGVRRLLSSRAIACPELASSVILSLSKDLGDRAVREILRQAQDDRERHNMRLFDSSG
jgi:hypothetical protein